MLARYHNVPFRRDVIERAAKDNLRGRSHPSLELIGNLSTLMGFTGTMTDLPEGQLGRAPFPAIAWVMDQPSLIHDITSQGVKAVVPEYGRVILPLSELVGDQAGARRDCERVGMDLGPAEDAPQGAQGLMALGLHFRGVPDGEAEVRPSSPPTERCPPR